MDFAVGTVKTVGRLLWEQTIQPGPMPAFASIFRPDIMWGTEEQPGSARILYQMTPFYSHDQMMEQYAKAKADPTIENIEAAVLARKIKWLDIGLTVLPVGWSGAKALGTWAARRELANGFWKELAKVGISMSKPEEQQALAKALAKSKLTKSTLFKGSEKQVAENLNKVLKIVTNGRAKELTPLKLAEKPGAFLRQAGTKVTEITDEISHLKPIKWARKGGINIKYALAGDKTKLDKSFKQLMAQIEAEGTQVSEAAVLRAARESAEELYTNHFVEQFKSALVRQGFSEVEASRQAADLVGKAFFNATSAKSLGGYWEALYSEMQKSYYKIAPLNVEAMEAATLQGASVAIKEPITMPKIVDFSREVKQQTLDSFGINAKAASLTADVRYQKLVEKNMLKWSKGGFPTDPIKAFKMRLPNEPVAQGRIQRILDSVIYAHRHPIEGGKRLLGMEPETAAYQGAVDEAGKLVVSWADDITNLRERITVSSAALKQEIKGMNVATDSGEKLRKLAEKELDAAIKKNDKSFVPKSLKARQQMVEKLVADHPALKKELESLRNILDNAVDIETKEKQLNLFKAIIAAGEKGIDDKAREAIQKAAFELVSADVDNEAIKVLGENLFGRTKRAMSRYFKVNSEVLAKRDALLIRKEELTASVDDTGQAHGKV